MELQLTEPGYFYADFKPTHVNRHKVQTRDRYFYIIGFSLGHPGQKPWWKIVGRKDRYKTAEEARDVLQREMERQN
jgi:hypothetical protein